MATAGQNLFDVTEAIAAIEKLGAAARESADRVERAIAEADRVLEADHESFMRDSATALAKAARLTGGHDGSA